MFVLLCTEPALVHTIAFQIWGLTTISEIFGGSDWPQNMNKTLLVIQCSGLPVLTYWHCYTLDFENAKTLYWLSECRLIPYGLLGKISSSSRKTNQKCAANVAQTTRQEHATSACAILLCYFIILFFLSRFGSHNYYQSFVNYNKQDHTVMLPPFDFADQLTLSFKFLIKVN